MKCWEAVYSYSWLKCAWHANSYSINELYFASHVPCFKNAHSSLCTEKVLTYFEWLRMHGVGEIQFKFWDLIIYASYLIQAWELGCIHSLDWNTGTGHFWFIHMMHWFSWFLQAAGPAAMVKSKQTVDTTIDYSLQMIICTVLQKDEQLLSYIMQNHFMAFFPIIRTDFRFLVVHIAWQTKLNINTYFVAIFYSLKISYVVSIECIHSASVYQSCVFHTWFNFRTFHKIWYHNIDSDQTISIWMNQGIQKDGITNTETTC